MIIERPLNFDVEQIAKSGQCFRIIETRDKVYRAITGDHYVEIKHLGDDKLSVSCDKDTWDSVWVPYFDLDTDYSIYVNKLVSLGGYLKEAAEFSSGIRILRQDPFETLMSFIISQRNRIPRIMDSVWNICKEMGELRIDPFTEKEFYTFPDINSFVEKRSMLADLKLGYREPYLRRSSYRVLLNGLDSYKTYEKVLELDGVGPKVANCYCLYGLHQLERFPIDTWMRYIIDTYFGGSIDISEFKQFAGVAQQYMFYYERSKGAKR